MIALLGERSAIIAVVGIQPNNIDDKASNTNAFLILDMGTIRGIK